MNSTELGMIAMSRIIDAIDIKGVIGLSIDAAHLSNEYYCYEDYCKERDLAYLGVASYALSKEADQKLFDDLDIDVIICCSWQRLIPNWLINKCRIGIIGAHGSSEGIERGRGRSPQNWALILNKSKFYISIFWITEGIDNGRVIDTRCYDLDKVDDIVSSYVKENMIVADMVIKALKEKKINSDYGSLQKGEFKYLPKRIASDGEIDWGRSCYEVYNFIRALTKPYPGAFSYVDDKDKIFIWSAIPIKGYDDSSEPGTILIKTDNLFLVKCGEGFILIKDYTATKETLKAGMKLKGVNYVEQIMTIVERHKATYDLPISDEIYAALKEEIE